MEQQSIYITHPKNKNMKPVCYCLDGKVVRAFGRNDYLNYYIYAREIESHKVLGACSFSQKSFGDDSIFVKDLEILNHNYDNCGIGTTLLNFVETYGIKRLKAKTSSLICCPEHGYEHFVENFYVHHGYLKASALGLMIKDLQKTVISEDMNINIRFRREIFMGGFRGDHPITIIDTGQKIYTTSDIHQRKEVHNYPFVLSGEKMLLPQNAKHQIEANITAYSFYDHHPLATCDFAIKKDGTAFVDNIEVLDENFQHCKLCSTLLYACENSVLEWGAKQLVVPTETQDPAQYVVDRFYEKHGYQKEPKQAPLTEHKGVAPVYFEEHDYSDFEFDCEYQSQKEDTKVLAKIK